MNKTVVNGLTSIFLEDTVKSNRLQKIKRIRRSYVAKILKINRNTINAFYRINFGIFIEKTETGIRKLRTDECYLQMVFE